MEVKKQCLQSSEYYSLWASISVSYYEAIRSGYMSNL